MDWMCTSSGSSKRRIAEVPQPGGPGLPLQVLHDRRDDMIAGPGVAAVGEVIGLGRKHPFTPERAVRSCSSSACGGWAGSSYPGMNTF